MIGLRKHISKMPHKDISRRERRAYVRMVLLGIEDAKQVQQDNEPSGSVYDWQLYLEKN